MEGFDVDNFKFSADILRMSAGNFEAFLKERYGRKLKAKERKALRDKFFGELDVDKDAEPI